MEEEWKDAKGYEGYYKVSNFGRVMSLNYQNRGYAQILIPKVNNKGYEHYELSKNGKHKDFLAHRIVAENFIPKEEGKDLVNHKDENPRNNRVDNLEWCTLSYNVNYSWNLHPERRKRPKNVAKKKRGPHTPYKYVKPLIQMDLDENVIAVHNFVHRYCKEMNYSETSITECCKGKRKTAYGYKWKFAE